jgi:hypothetical protein
MAERKQAQAAATPMSEEQVRAIVREEMAKLLAWRHDADHGSVQSRRDTQRTRDRAAGLNSNEE